MINRQPDVAAARRRSDEGAPQVERLRLAGIPSLRERSDDIAVLGEKRGSDQGKIGRRTATPLKVSRRRTVVP